MDTIKKFSELEKSADPKVRKASIVRKMTIAVKGIQASNKKADIIINKVHEAFADEKRVFTPVQVKKAILAFKKMNKVLSRHIKKSFSMLRVAIKSEIPNETIASQLEDLYAVKGKIALLYAQLTGSLAEEYEDEIMEDDEDEFVELDESGYVVEDEDPVEEIIEEEPMTDDEAVEGSVADETVADETIADETVADETAETTADEDLVDDDIVEDVVEDVIEDVVEDVVDEEVIEDVIEDELEEIDIELEEDGIDGALAGEIFGQEDEFIDFEDDVDDEIDATAALKNKKIASAKRTQGNSGLSEDGILNSLMEQELVL